MNIDPEHALPELPTEKHPARPYVILLAVLALILVTLFGGTGGSGTGTAGGVGEGNRSELGGGKNAADGSGPGNGPGDGKSAAPAAAATAAHASAVPAGKVKTPAPPPVSGPGPAAAAQAGEPGPAAIVPDDFTASWKSPPGAPPPPSGGSGSGGGKSGFYGVGVSGDADVVFLVDVSGSMSGEKLETLKKELWKGISTSSTSGSLLDAGRGGTFRIVAFSNGTWTFPADGRGIPFRGASGLRELKNFIDGLRADGGTNMTGAWGQVLESIRKHPAQVVYALSDGVPTDGDPVPMLKRELNSEITVHSISIGQDSELMKRMAREHNGTYTRK